MYPYDCFDFGDGSFGIIRTREETFRVAAKEEDPMWKTTWKGLIRWDTMKTSMTIAALKMKCLIEFFVCHKSFTELFRLIQPLVS